MTPGSHQLDAECQASAKVIFPLHGIRTRAEWQRAFADVCQVKKWNCRLEKWNFGRFSLLQFFSPLSRKAKIWWFRKTYYDEVNYRGLNLNEKQHPSVVAHSFGTYILGNALLKYDYLCFNKVILCGSILPCDFPWDKLIERGQVQAVRNEYGVKDIWAKRVGWFIPATGPSGVSGFICRHERFEQAEFHYEHSEYFEKGHIEAYWVPFLETNLSFTEKKSFSVPSPRPTCPIVLLIIILLASAILVAIAAHPIYGGRNGKEVIEDACKQPDPPWWCILDDKNKDRN